MKVRIGREELLTGLQRVQGVVENGTPCPSSRIFCWKPSTTGGNRRHGIWNSACAGLYKASVLEAGGVTISAQVV